MQSWSPEGTERLGQLRIWKIPEAKALFCGLKAVTLPAKILVLESQDVSSKPAVLLPAENRSVVLLSLGKYQFKFHLESLGSIKP